MKILSIILLVCPLVVAQAQDDNDSLADDQSLVDEEFSFSQLFDQNYGLLLGYGGPRYRLFVGGSYFVTNYFNVVLSLGMFGEYQQKEEDNDKKKQNEEQPTNEAKTMAGNLQLRYYPHAKLPLTVFVGAGLAYWDGTTKTDSNKDSYQMWELYGESGVVVFYFWRKLYIEATILAIVSGHNLTLKSDADKTTKDNIAKETEGLDQYGMLAGTWNFAIGYFF